MVSFLLSATYQFEKKAENNSILQYIAMEITHVKY